MHDFAGEEIGERGEADVGMRAHVDAARNAARELHGSDVVEEDERADHATAVMRQHAADLEVADVPTSLLDDVGDDAPEVAALRACAPDRRPVHRPARGTA